MEQSSMSVTTNTLPISQAWLSNSKLGLNHNNNNQQQQRNQLESWSFIDGNDLQRMVNLSETSGLKPNPPTKRELEAENLHQLSKIRIAKWTQNTPETKSAKQERLNKIKELEETKRVEQDEIDRKFAAEERERFIERAKHKLWQQQDKVKNFHSSVLLSEVLKERENQIKTKRDKDEEAKKENNQWMEIQRKSIEKSKEKDEEEMISKLNRGVEERKMRELQLEEMKRKQIEQMRLLKAEGEAIKRGQIAYLDSVKKDWEAQRAKHKQASEETKKLNDFLIDLKEKERIMEKEHEKRMMSYNEQKDALDEMKKEREKERYATHQRNRQALIELHVKHRQNTIRSEEERYAKDAEMMEVRMKEKEENEAKAKKRAKERCHRSWDTQLAKKHQMKLEEEEKSKQMLAQWQEERKESQEEEYNEKVKTRERSLLLMEDLKNQMDDQRQTTEKSNTFEGDFERRQMLLQVNEERKFKDYTLKVIDDYRERGYNIKPIVLSLRKKKSLELLY